LITPTKTSSSSSSAFGGFITANRSWGLGVAQKFFIHEDRWRARLAGTYADVRYNYYGIGTANGDAGESVLLDQRGWGALGELMYRFHGFWYGGARYRFVTQKSSYRPNPGFNPDIPSSQLDLNTGSLGPRVTRDTRDERDYPREGSLFDVLVGFNDKRTGSGVNYQTYDISYSKYVSLSSRQVLAFRGVGCFASGNVPFYDECLLTPSENLRGYRASRYRDRAMAAAQAEYRVEVWKRLGFVGFGGLGEVGPKFSDFNSNTILPGGGVGVRYRITRESHVNLRFDYAWGKNSHAAYFFIGEAF
jgi:outer membrane protein assembly factor BamA